MFVNKVINYFHKQLNEKSDPFAVKNMYNNDGSIQMTTTSSTSSTTAAASFRPYGNLLSTNNHFINSNLSPSPSGFLQHATSTQGGGNKLMPGSISPNGINIALVNELDLTGHGGRLGGGAGTGPGGLSTSGGHNNGGFSSAGKNVLLSSSASSIQHQHQIDHSKENLEM